MDIALNLDIATTPDRLFEALTTQSGIAGWYTPQTKAEPKQGSPIEFGFFSYLWGQYMLSLKLLLETGTGEPFGSPGADHYHATAQRRYFSA